MVLTDERTFMSRLTASWSLRADDLRERLADDPTNEAAWLWTIRLRICDYLTRRYVESARPSSKVWTPPPTSSVETARPEPGAPYEPSADAVEYSARFRGHCQDALARIEASATDGRRSALETGDALVESIRARHTRARERELRRRERRRKRKRFDADRESP